MPEEIPVERVYEALDLMKQAGWLSEYKQDGLKTEISWTERGKQRVVAIFLATNELGPEKLDFELWWAVAFIAHLPSRPGSPGFGKFRIGKGL